MTWTAIVPIKGSGPRKTRLAGVLDEAQRQRLSDQLLQHVLAVLGNSPGISEIIILSDVRPEQWEGHLCIDRLRGLNTELKALSTVLGDKPLLIVHADLPLLSCEDIDALLAAAQAKGGAIAPDRHGSGTNAIALRDATGFDFAFGSDSFARHCAMRGRSLQAVKRPGLALDIDTPEDFELLSDQASWLATL